MAKTNQFEPDYAVAPGATLKETLEARGISQSDFALRAGMAEKTISQIINGIAPITYDTADKFELTLGIPASFWNRRELSYRESLARIEATERMSADTAWLDKIPVKILKERGYLRADAEGSELVRESLRFFGVSSVSAWQDTWGLPVVQYRGKSVQEKKPGYVAAWLRIGELQADKLQVEAFDAGEFKRMLNEVRRFTVKPAATWSQEVPKLLASAGVALVFTKEIASAGVSGATRWLTKDKALMQISLKYKTDDQLWFTLFHEAGHIGLHGKKHTFLEFGISNDTDEEHEANAFARDMLIPPLHKHRLPYLKNRVQIREFAASLDIAPGIVVGRLQHDGLAFPSVFNDLKRKLSWGK